MVAATGPRLVFAAESSDGSRSRVAGISARAGRVGVSFGTPMPAVATLVLDPRFAGWWRPPTWRLVAVSRCRGCREPVAYARTDTPSRATVPLNRDGSPHVAT